MTYEHQELAAGRWQKLSLLLQMANIGSEAERAMNWRKKGNEEYAKRAFWRALELFDLTASDKKNVHRLKEVLRAREAFADFFAGENEYETTENQWHNYFYPFNFRARRDD